MGLIVLDLITPSSLGRSLGNLSYCRFLPDGCLRYIGEFPSLTGRRSNLDVFVFNFLLSLVIVIDDPFQLFMAETVFFTKRFALSFRFQLG